MTSQSVFDMLVAAVCTNTFGRPTLARAASNTWAAVTCPWKAAIANTVMPRLLSNNSIVQRGGGEDDAHLSKILQASPCAPCEASRIALAIDAVAKLNSNLQCVDVGPICHKLR